jgi:S1-C subfamily serine protease
MLFIGFVVPHEAQSLAGQNQSQPTTSSRAVASETNSPLAIRASFADIVEKVTPAVVTIRAEKKNTNQTQESPFADDPLLREFFGRQLPQMRQTPRIERGMGSGVIIESNGTILTNNHVVKRVQLRLRLIYPTDERLRRKSSARTKPAIWRF